MDCFLGIISLKGFQFSTEGGHFLMGELYFFCGGTPLVVSAQMGEEGFKNIYVVVMVSKENPVQVGVRVSFMFQKHVDAVRL